MTKPDDSTAYNPSEKQKGSSKTSRIPIKIVPYEKLANLYEQVPLSLLSLSFSS